MKTCIFAMSTLTLTLSCAVTSGLPEGDAADAATSTASAPTSPDSGEAMKVVPQAPLPTVVPQAPLPTVVPQAPLPTVVPQGQLPTVVPQAPLPTVVPQAPPSTVDACRACNGDWGMHGLSDTISQTESCDCRTNDGGKRCTDGIDCQGMCVANADNPAYDVVDIGPPARGFLVGRCSEFVTAFGCNALIDAGARDDGPVFVAAAPPVLCVD